MLAPVLARLVEISGVTGAWVECSGTYFLVGATDSATLDRIGPALRDVLGPSMRRVEDAARDAQLARRARGELWFSSGDIRGLSYVEGRLLATRFVDAVTATVPLDDRAAELTLEVARSAIFDALDDAHDAGGRSTSSWFWEQWPAIVGRIAVQLERYLPQAVASEVCAALRAEGDEAGGVVADSRNSSSG